LIAGFRPGSRATLVSVKVAKTSDAQFGLIRFSGRGNWEAGQLAPLKQGPPMLEERPPIGPNSSRQRGEKEVEGLRDRIIPTRLSPFERGGCRG